EQSECAEHGVHLAEILEEEIRGGCSELLARIIARGDGHCLRANRTGAAHIVRSITEHEYALGRKLCSMPFPGTRPGEMTELISVVVVVRIRTEFKIVPHSVMR